VRLFTKVCAGLDDTCGFDGFNISSLVVCFNVAELIFLDKILKYVTYVEIFQIAGFCQNAGNPKPSKNFPKEKDLSRKKCYES